MTFSFYLKIFSFLEKREPVTTFKYVEVNGNNEPVGNVNYRQPTIDSVQPGDLINLIKREFNLFEKKFSK